MYRYIQQIPSGGDLLDVSSLLPDVSPLVVIKIDDHHAKLHIHTLSEHDPQIGELIERLARRHTDLRFAIYHEHDQTYRTLHAKAGKVHTSAEKTRE